ncbi:MAG: pantoate--beta-alanine ligase [Syntrophobacter sp. DG_60]|nr:MAG: pantoate--beta-alanine ligase [Syntrophobacter sp. DG_60]
MKIIYRVKEMQTLSNKLRKEGKKIAFVPTLGYFHKGHLSLMKRGKNLANVLIISIFVNPIQFGAGEDFRNYPRDLKRDLSLAETVGVDMVFVPKIEDIYPSNYQTYVEVAQVTQPLCGISRSGHFRGVTTIVAKLFNIVKPDIALFGLKDYQQYTVIRRMVKDLNYDIDIIGCPTVREPDGLAMSSRNTYLTVEQRKSALCLFESLKLAEKLVKNGQKNAKAIIEKIISYIESRPYTQIDYVKICDPETLKDLDYLNHKVLLALAVKVGEARLIDNAILEVS